MSKIFIDVTVLLRSRAITGIQRVCIEVINRLIKECDFEIVLLSEKGDNSYYIVQTEKFIKKYDGTNKRIGKLITEEIVDFTSIADTEALFLDIDAVWNATNLRLKLYPILKSRNIKIVTFVYDMIVFSHPQYTSDLNIAVFPPYIAAVMQYSDLIIVNTDDARNSILMYAEEAGLDKKLQVTVIPLGGDFANKEYDENLVSKQAIEIAQKAPYILMVSTIEPRKNHTVLLDAFDEGLKKLGIQLVFAGRRGWNVEALLERIDNHPEKGTCFHFLEEKNDETIRFLYQNAFIVFFPSFIEGYGLSTIEAIQQGTPVALSDVPVMHEVGGNYCDYFDPNSPKEVIQIVQKYLSDEEAYQERKNTLAKYNVFSWDNMVARLHEALISQTAAFAPVFSELKQFVLLGARCLNILNTLPYVEARMQYLEEIVVCCPNKIKQEILDNYSGKKKLVCITDEEILNGLPLPEDHAKRNFYLRALMMNHSTIRDVFVMSDDDYRPLFDIPTTFYIQNNRFNAYYCYDLQDWCRDIPLATSFDKSMERTLSFLKENALPTLNYAAHMPQVINKKWYVEMLKEYPYLIDMGVCEWSVYFNYAVNKHPEYIKVCAGASLSWPGRGTDWRIKILPKQYAFENYYPENYEADGIFKGISNKFDENADYNSVLIVNRWKEYIQPYIDADIMNDRFISEYCKQYGRYPEIKVHIEAEGIRFFGPQYIKVRKNSVLRLRLKIEQCVEGHYEMGTTLGLKQNSPWTTISSDTAILPIVAPAEAGSDNLRIKIRGNEKAESVLNIKTIIV